MTNLKFDRLFRISPELYRPTRLRRCRLEECHAACCLHGVWVDPLEMEDILRHKEFILPHMPEGRRDPGNWFGGEREKDPFYPSGCVISTTALPNPAHYGGTECIFLRPDWLCALQVASRAAGHHPWRWKPFHCIIHPITIEDGQFTIASDEELLAEEGGCFRAGTPGGRMSDFLAEEIEFLSAAGDGME
jgi:hypothetical protein